jgi:hypothetical protein
MDKEYLKDYAEKEREERKKFLTSLDEDFAFGRDRFPPKSRFIKLESPLAKATGYVGGGSGIWSQVPFCGSLLVQIAPLEKRLFEMMYFKTSEIPKIVDFVKDTGKMQFGLSHDPLRYEGLDFLDTIFKEVDPPCLYGLILEDLVDDFNRKYVVASQTFETLARAGLTDVLRKIASMTGERSITPGAVKETFIYLKALEHPLVSHIEDLMVDNPHEALLLILHAAGLIIQPIIDTCCDMRNKSLEEITYAHKSMPTYTCEELRFPCEIGKFLVKKLTRVPLGLQSCYELLEHYGSRDLQKVMAALNGGIVSNNPDVVNKTAEELCEILDAIWDDKTISRQVSEFEIGMPLLIGALGFITAGPAGAALAGPVGAIEAGFLSGLGFRVSDKTVTPLFDSKKTRLSEKMAKWRKRSYQINVYDFKRKYKEQIPHPDGLPS